MHKFFILQIAMMVALLAFIGLAISVGYGQAGARSPVQPEGECSAPCWWGIQPGETRITQANSLLISQGYVPANTGPRIIYTPPDYANGCIVSLQNQDGIVRQTRLSICPGLRLGDVLAAMGQPDYMATSFLTFNFDGGTTRAQLHIMECGERISPFSPVQSVVLSEQGTEPQETVALRWQGFALPWRYLRSQPNLVVLIC